MSRCVACGSLEDIPEGYGMLCSNCRKILKDATGAELKDTVVSSVTMLLIIERTEHCYTQKRLAKALHDCERYRNFIKKHLRKGGKKRYVRVAKQSGRD